jgi:hypothetical protein
VVTLRSIFGSVAWVPFEYKALHVAFAAASLVAIGTAGWHVWMNRRLIDMQIDAARLEQQLQAARVSASAASEPTPDFVALLPDTIGIDPIVTQLQRSAASLGVAFASVAINESAPNEQTLGRTRLTVTLRGSYPNTKTVLAETFDRYPEVLLERLTLRRVSAPTDVETRADLLLATRPRAASAAGGP